MMFKSNTLIACLLDCLTFLVKINLCGDIAGALDYTEFIYKLKNDRAEFVPLKKIIDTIDGG